MALTPYDPFRQLANVRKDLDHFFTDLPSLFNQDHQLGSIRVDVHETESEVIATCDLPGLESKEDVHIDISQNTLNISGIINKTREMKEEHFHRQERYTGRFQRSISLPTSVSRDGVKASYRNGVLKVRMPKVENGDMKKINVEFH